MASTIQALKETATIAIGILPDYIVEEIYKQYKESRAVKETTSEVIKESPKKKAPKKEAKKEAEEKKEKRIGRMTAAYMKQLQSELTKANVEVNFDEKKEVEKIKKAFLAYIEDLTEDDFTAKKIPDHMRDFANLQTNKEEEKEEEKKDITVHKLSLEELQSIEKISESDELEKGVYWDADNGRHVTGPERDQDEDLDDKTFKKTKYIVGEKTGRVYLDDDESFVGYIGVGKFKEMK